MDPFRVGLFSEGQRPLPVNRLVLALGSDKAGVVFPAASVVDSDGFTAYNIWCAGLSLDTFRDIDNDVECYKSLFLQPLRTLDLFDLKWSAQGD